MPQPHAYVTVQGAKGRRAEVTEFDETLKVNRVVESKDLPLTGGGNLAQFQLQEGQSFQLFNPGGRPDGEWVWLNPVEQAVIKAHRESK